MDKYLEAVNEFETAFHPDNPPPYNRPKTAADRDALLWYIRYMAVVDKGLKEYMEEFGPHPEVQRIQLIHEELTELAEAFVECDRVKVLDALTDLEYVVNGGYVALDFAKYKEAAFKAVHESNMSKLDENGKPIIAPNGRVMKSHRYKKPDLAWVIAVYDDVRGEPE